MARWMLRCATHVSLQVRIQCPAVDSVVDRQPPDLSNFKVNLNYRRPRNPKLSPLLLMDRWGSVDRVKMARFRMLLWGAMAVDFLWVGWGFVSLCPSSASPSAQSCLLCFCFKGFLPNTHLELQTPSQHLLPENPTGNKWSSLCSLQLTSSIISRTLNHPSFHGQHTFPRSLLTDKALVELIPGHLYKYLLPHQLILRKSSVPSYITCVVAGVFLIN